MAEKLAHSVEFRGILGLNGDGILNHMYSSSNNSKQPQHSQ